MANPYAYNVVTFAGAALIAQATAANPIVIVGAISRATAASSDEDLAAKDASWYTGKTGRIEAVSASANVAKIVARFDPDGARQDAKSVAVTARLASQTDADAIVLTAKSDPDATAILPGSGDTLAYVRFPFNIYIQTSGSVQVTPGASASMADLARFVSLHKAGDPTAGDAQTIKGEKTFANEMHAADISASGDVGCAHLTASGDITTAQSYVCSGQGRLRARGTLWCAAKESGNTEATLRLDASTPNEPELYLYLTNENGDTMGALYLTKDCELYLESDFGPTRVGKASNPIDYVIAYNLTAKDNVSVYSNNANNTTAATINLHSQTTDAPSITAQLENSSGDVLADVTLDADASEAMCYLYMDSDIYATCIGKPNKRLDYIYAWNLRGIIPHPTASGEPPVGSIFFGAVHYSVSTASSVTFGQLLQVGSGNVTIITSAGYSTTNNRFETGGDVNFTTGKYRALSVGSEPGRTYCFVLLIRVQ